MKKTCFYKVTDADMSLQGKIPVVSSVNLMCTINFKTDFSLPQNIFL